MKLIKIWNFLDWVAIKYSLTSAREIWDTLAWTEAAKEYNIVTEYEKIEEKDIQTAKDILVASKVAIEK